MSGNNSPEIVTQKEFEKVLTNKAFDAKKFLELYSEWKSTHDTGTFAALRSMHQDAGYKNKNIIFGSESEMHEIAVIVKNFLDKKTQITTAVTTETAAVAATNNSNVPSAQTNTNSAVSSNESISDINNYNLKACSDYTHEHLSKYGKSMKELQSALGIKMNIPLEINGIFDVATITAVIAFKKAAGLDQNGLMSDMAIEKLFGISGVPSEPTTSSPNVIAGTTRREDGQVEPTRRPIARQVAPSQPVPSIIRTTSPETNNSIADIHQQITTAYTDFKNYATQIDTWFGTFKKSKEDVQNQHVELNKKIKTLVDLLDMHGKNPNPSIKDTVAAYRINLSYYLVNDLEGIGNNLNKNVIVSQNLAIAVLNQDKKRIEPIPEGKQAIFNTLDSIKNTPLGNTIAEALQKNPDKDIYEIISNPTIKGGWESAYSKIFDKYLSSLDTAIDTTEKDSTLTTHQKKALHHLKDIRGKNGWYDLKTEHTTAMWQGVKLGGAVIAGAAATYMSAGTLGPWVAAGVGALVATSGTSMARGYWDGKETLIDGTINMFSFGGGALVVKIGQAARSTQAISSMGKIGAISTGIAIDGVGNIGIGVAGDSVRAHLHGEDLNTWDSLKMNAIPWAIFALVMNARGFKVPKKVLDEAKDLEKSVAHAEATAHLGKSPKADLDNIAAHGPELEKWGKTQQNNPAHIAPPEHSGAKPNTNLHGDPIAPNPIAAKPNQAKPTNERNVSTVSRHEPIHVDQHTAHGVSEHTTKTVNQTIAGWTDNKAVKLAWDITTKEIQPGGALRSILVFPANIMRLPAINARKIAELWMKKGDKGFEFTPGWENIGKSVKIAAMPSSEPFKGFTQSTLTLMTMGTVAYMTWQEVQKSNPHTPASLTWGLTIGYLKNMNYPLPIEFADWFFKNKINV